MEQIYETIGFDMTLVESSIVIRFRVPDREAPEGFVLTPAVVLPAAVALAFHGNLEAALQQLPDSAFAPGIPLKRQHH